ncbi:D-glycero-alpha-D-manno-heptose-1,7-bisphosphate 7-phosphatase [Metabacillus indicus]|uniref:D-glycero-alpha-D-manno-heptose-1,7-bisphosphate 7-phosphatase n=1 Tax=Metabacillus indicus TaxID=246786 RepID=UPI003CF045B4
MMKAVFLDRDGVINEVLTERVRFVNNPSQLYLLDGAAEGVRILCDKGYKVFVVTNQGGVGLGYMKEAVLKDIHRKMVEEIEKAGGKIEEIAYCAHSPHAGCECRKPGSLMITDLAERHGITIEESYMIGDRDVDIMAGKRAGTKTILVGSSDHCADMNFPSLLDAAKWIGEQQESR